MRCFTPSGSLVTSTPPTVALPDVGFSRPQSMRMVVDFPAPLLPRNPKTSPRATSKLTRSTATNAPKRRVRSRTSIAASCRGEEAEAGLLSANGPLQARLREAHVGDRAGAIELRLQPGGLRIEHFGVRGDARPVPLADDAFGFDRGANLAVGGGDRLAARLKFQRARADLEGHVAVEVAHARLQRRRVRLRLPLLGAAPSAVPERPRHVHRRIPRRLPRT